MRAVNYIASAPSRIRGQKGKGSGKDVLGAGAKCICKNMNNNKFEPTNQLALCRATAEVNNFASFDSIFIRSQLHLWA